MFYPSHSRTTHYHDIIDSYFNVASTARFFLSLPDLVQTVYFVIVRNWYKVFNSSRLGSATYFGLFVVQTYSNPMDDLYGCHRVYYIWYHSKTCKMLSFYYDLFFYQGQINVILIRSQWWVWFFFVFVCVFDFGFYL